MEALFTKLDAIPLPNTQLNDEDQEAIDVLHNNFMNELEDIAGITEQLSKYTQPSDWMARKIEEFISDLNRAIPDLRTTHQWEIINHFNSKYTLGLDPYPTRRAHAHEPLNPSNEDLTDTVINYVIDSLAGRTFSQLALDNLTREFTQHLHNTKRSRKQITLPHFVNTRDNYRGGVQLDWGASNKLHTLGRAITAFATHGKATNNRTHFDVRAWEHNSTPPFGEPEATGTSDRHPTITIYKNGNVRLTFTSEELAAEFVTFHNINLRD